MVDKRASADATRLRETWIAYDISRRIGSSDATHRQIVDQIATLAGANDIDRLHRGISVELTEHWSSYRRIDDSKTKMEVLEKDWSKQTIGELKSLQHLSHELSACLGNLGVLARIILTEQTQELIAPLKKLAATSAKCLSGIRKLTPRALGRPSSLDMLSPPANLSFHEFTLHLLWDVREAGGRLTFDKNTGSGTLTKAIELLRPHVPPNLIPNSLPLSTLWRVKQFASIPAHSLLKSYRTKSKRLHPVLS
jgi:hypothetical protein